MPEPHEKQTVRTDFAQAEQLLVELTELNSAVQYLPNSPTNFEVAVPNVIHGTKLLNLPARRAEAQK